MKIVSGEANYNLIVFIDSFYVGLNLVYLYYYLSIHASGRDHIIRGVPLAEEGFDEYLTLAQKSKIVARICGSICVLSMFKIFQQLQLKYFQTFRIIFFSIRQSLKSIFWFFCVVFIGLLALVAIRMTVVNNRDLQYSSFGSVVSKVLLGIFVRNPSNPPALNRAMVTDSFGLVFFEYIWYVLTNVIVIPFFIGLVYSNYAKNKQKYQLALAVIEEIDRMVASATEGQASSLLQFKFYSQFERIKNSELFGLLEMKKKIETEQVRRFLLAFTDIILILKRDYPNLKVNAKSSLAIKSPTSESPALRKATKSSLSEELAQIDAQRKKDLEMKSRQENVKSLKDIFLNNISEIFLSKSINKFISKDTMLLITQQLRLDVCSQKLNEISSAMFPLSHNVLLVYK